MQAVYSETSRHLSVHQIRLNKNKKLRRLNLITVSDFKNSVLQLRNANNKYLNAVSSLPYSEQLHSQHTTQ